VGDTLLADAAKPSIDQFGPDWVTKRVPPFDSDLVVANLEGPITTRTEPWNPGQTWSYGMQPEIASTLGRLGVDVVSLANNHAMDRGPEGLADTTGHLKAAGIKTLGAGFSAEAGQPLLVTSRHGTLAIVAFADVEKARGATTDSPGVKRLTVAHLRSGYETARRAGATWTVAFVHWGENYTPVDDVQRGWASAFAAAGYDLVIGSGPHIVQPIEVVGRTPVVYSVGNFILGTPGRYAQFGVTGHGLVLTTRFSRSAGITMAARCIVTDNRFANFQPQPCPDEGARTTLGALSEAIRIEGNTGTLQFPAAAART
ncbi:MAG: CapA family protein, partial [Actinobacteria bacterium]|nr:CapA family protein [Actinomycetota bacterium]